MFWPDQAELSAIEEWFDPAGVDLPPVITVVDSMRQVARAALMLGYWAPRLRIGRPQASGMAWTTIDLEDFTVYQTTDNTPPPYTGVTVELLCEPVVDRELVVYDDNSIGPAITTSEDTDTPVVDPSVSYAVQGSNGPLTFVVGSPSEWSGGPPPFADEISSIIDDAVMSLGGLHPDATNLRRPGGGLVWLFDPQHWDRTDESVPGDLEVALEPIQHPSSFLADQISAMPGRCSLSEILEALGTFSASYQVWRAIADGLSSRGERHRLTQSDLDRLAPVSGGPPWIDAVAWCLRRGVVVIDSLLEVPQPPDPIEVVSDDDATVRITVWGEEEIICTRVHPSGHSIWGGINWDYAPGTKTTPPHVIIVASRGIKIACSEVVRSTLDPVVDTASIRPPPWALKIHRVQHTDLVPPVGGAIDTTLLNSPAYIDDGLPLLIQPKPDGVQLVYPAPPPGAQIAGSAHDNIVRDVIELTVDPFSAEDWYELDCHSAPYVWAGGGIPNATALHVVVRATMNVEIATNRASYDNDNPLAQLLSWFSGDDLDEVTGKGVITNGFPNYVDGSASYVSGWSFSAEFWRVMEPPVAGAFGTPWDVLERPWVRELPVLPAALARETEMAALPSLGPTRQWQIGEHTFSSYTDGDAELFPAAYVYRQYGYVDSLVFDLVDGAIGFVPFIGDLVDVAEVILAWQTGYDKWGRPVSGFQLSLMMIGAAVPFVSAGFARRAGQKIADNADAFHAGPADYLAGSIVPAFDGFVDEAAEAATAPRLWGNTGGVTSVALGRSTQLGDDLFEALGQNSVAITRLADDVVDVAYGTGVRAADLVGDDGGFWMHALHVPLTRAQRNSPTLPSPYVWLDMQTTGRLSTVTGALVHVDPAPVRLIQPRGRFPSAMRALQTGTKTAIAQWSPTDVADRVDAAIGLITTRAWSGRGVFEGAVRPAAEIITDGHLPVRAEAADLFGAASGSPSLMKAGASKLADLAATRPGGLEEMLGNAVVAGKELSDNERALRITKALYCAALEVEEHGLHVLVDLADTSTTAARRSAAETVFTDELAPAVLDFVRQWVNRSIHEHALRFEFRQSAVAEAVLRSSDRELLHQLRLVSLDGGVLKSGPDSTLFMQALATFLQWKAYQSPVDLFGGKISAELVDGSWVVKGGDFVQQHITDQLRAALQAGKVPGPGVPLPTQAVTDPAQMAGWVDVSRVSVQVFDDSYMISTAITKLTYAAQRKGSKTLDIVEDVTDMPKSMRRFLAARLGTPYRLERHTVLVDALRQHIIAYVRTQEDVINTALATPEMVAALGRQTSVIIRAASEGLDDIPVVLATRL